MTRTVLVTAGPTREAVDPVRYVGNRSSGRMGYAIARAAWRRGADVTLVSGPVQIDAPPGVEVVAVETAVQMHAAVSEAIASADVTVFAAAVSDFRPSAPEAGKVKRSEVGDEIVLPLTANPDIARTTGASRKPGSVTVGFALETSDLLENARKKLEAKAFDILVANDATEEGSGFDVDTNRVTILTKEGEPEHLPLLSKDEVAEEILDRVREHLQVDG